MRYVLALILLIIVFIVWVLVSRMTVRIVYREDVLRLRFSLLFFRFTYDSSVTKPKKEKKKQKKDSRSQKASHTEVEKVKEQSGKEKESEKNLEKKSIEYWIGKLKEYYQSFRDVTTVAAKILRALRYKIQIRGVAIEVVYGTGDAAKTGMAYGGAWAVVSQLYMLLSQYLIFEYPRLELTPVFDQKCFSAAAEGIICFRPVHIIKAAVIGLSAYYKRLSKKKKPAADDLK